MMGRKLTATQCNDIYFHSGRAETTCRVWRLLPAQFDDLVGFLLSEDSSRPAPFPILASNANRHRHDAWDAIALHHIFRDPWERKYPAMKPDDGRDVRSASDYPELEDWMQQLHDAAKAAPARELPWDASREQERMPWLGGEQAKQEEEQEGQVAEDTRVRRDSVSSHHSHPDSSQGRGSPRTPPSPSVALPATEHDEPTASTKPLPGEERDPAVHPHDGTSWDALGEDG
jgi:hypothetical protein